MLNLFLEFFDIWNWFFYVFSIIGSYTPESHIWCLFVIVLLIATRSKPNPGSLEFVLSVRWVPACLDSLDRHLLLLTSTTRVTEFQLRTLVSMLEWRPDAWPSENFFLSGCCTRTFPGFKPERDTNTRYTRSSSTRKIYKLCAIFFGYPQIILLTPPAQYRIFSPERNMISPTLKFRLPSKRWTLYITKRWTLYIKE
jgi:hypothetical protein